MGGLLLAQGKDQANKIHTFFHTLACTGYCSKFEMAAVALRTVTATAVLATVGATAAQLSNNPGALSVFTLGLVQGAVVFGLLFLLTKRSSAATPSPAGSLLAAAASPSPLKPASPPPPSPAAVDEAAAQDEVTPRSLLKNLSATETSLVSYEPYVEPRSTRSTNVEVEYTLEEYETLKKQKKQQQSKKSTPLKIKEEKVEPDSGVPSRRKSLRTPKASTRYASD